MMDSNSKLVIITVSRKVLALLLTSPRPSPNPSARVNKGEGNLQLAIKERKVVGWMVDGPAGYRVTGCPKKNAPMFELAITPEKRF